MTTYSSLLSIIAILFYFCSLISITNAFIQHFLKPKAVRFENTPVFKNKERLKSLSLTIHEQDFHNQSPFPQLPSLNFQRLALSQFEILSQSLPLSPIPHPTSTISTSSSSSSENNEQSKIKSIALYLPRENSNTGQLEFIPSVIYPNPIHQRIFIANDADSGQPPEVPNNDALQRLLIGFVHAKSVLPTYPFVNNNNNNHHVDNMKVEHPSAAAGIGDVEECEDFEDSNSNQNIILSCPLFSGSNTLGVLVVWPQEEKQANTHNGSFWTNQDKIQISRIAYSLSLALVMDMDHWNSQYKTEQLRRALSDNLHQVRNPLQALRTFGKLLQRKIALEEQMQMTNSTDGFKRNMLSSSSSASLSSSPSSNGAIILSLAENIIAQSDRVIDLLLPMDDIVMALEHSSPSSSVEQYFDSEDSFWNQEKNYATNNNEDEVMHWGANSSSSTSFSFSNCTAGTDTAASKHFTPPTTFSNATFETLQNDNYHEVPIQFPINMQDTAAVFVSRKDLGTESNNEFSSEQKFSTSSSQTKEKNYNLQKDQEKIVSYIPDIIEPIITAFQVIAEEKSICFHYTIRNEDDLPGVPIIPIALQEALSNVIENSIKYVKYQRVIQSEYILFQNKFQLNAKPEIQVTLQPNELISSIDKPGVTIIVKDNGIGIPFQERNHVFQRSFRSQDVRYDNHENISIDGSGLGLDISKKLLNSMNATLDIIYDVDTDDVFAKKCRYDGMKGTIMRIVLFR